MHYRPMSDGLIMARPGALSHAMPISRTLAEGVAAGIERELAGLVDERDALNDRIALRRQMLTELRSAIAAVEGVGGRVAA